MIESLGYIIIVGIIIGIGIPIYNYTKRGLKNGIVDGIAVSFLSGIVGFTISLFVCFVSTTFLPKIYTTIDIPIASLVSNHEISGSFILGSGSINSTEYYIYFEKRGEHTYMRGRTRAYLTLIVEDDSQEPKFTYQRECAEGNKLTGTLFVNDTCDTVNRALIVPTNTIVKQFEIK